MPIDHCTAWFEGWWAACCAAHDLAYADPLIDRLTADQELAACVAGTGAAGVGIAALMYAGVRLFGGWFRRRSLSRSNVHPAPARRLFHAPSKEAPMSAGNFETIMDHIFRHEGGYVDHPSDPGGATNMGVTIGTLRDYRGAAVTKDDVRNLTKAEAREIYRKRYWDLISGDELPSGIDLCTMDSAVNSGPSRGAKWLQRALGVKADGRIGTVTLAAAESAEAAVIIERMCDDRMDFLRSLSTWGTFGIGWTRRVEAVRSLALTLAKDAPEPVARPAQPISPEEIHKTNNEPWYQSRVTWGAIISGVVPILAAAGVVLDVADQETVVIGLTAAGTTVGAILTLIGRWRAKRPIGAARIAR